MIARPLALAPSLPPLTPSIGRRDDGQPLHSRATSGVSLWLLDAVEWRIVVLGAVVNDEAALRKEEAIRFDLPRCLDDLLRLLRRELRHIIAELPLVRAVRDHETEAERIVLDDTSAEVMSLDHLQVLDWLRSDAEAHGQADGLQAEEVRSKVVLDQALRRVVCIVKIRLALDLVDGYVHQRDVGDHVSDPEALELELGPVVGESAEELVSWASQLTDVFGGDLVGDLLRSFSHSNYQNLEIKIINNFSPTQLIN